MSILALFHQLNADMLRHALSDAVDEPDIFDESDAVGFSLFVDVNQHGIPHTEPNRHFGLVTAAEVFGTKYSK